MTTIGIIITVALCVAGLLVLSYVLKLLLVLFVVGAQAQIEKIKEEEKRNEDADDKQ